jgi:hypothetical protein
MNINSNINIDIFMYIDISIHITVLVHVFHAVMKSLQWDGDGGHGRVMGMKG